MLLFIIFSLTDLVDVLVGQILTEVEIVALRGLSFRLQLLVDV